MKDEKIIEIFKASDGFCVAEITSTEKGTFSLWQRNRTSSGAGNSHSFVNEFQELPLAQSEAQNIRIKYEQNLKD